MAEPDRGGSDAPHASGELLVPGVLVVGVPVSGPLLTLREPLSFWGGLDPDTGVIIDRNHCQAGVSLRDQVVLIGATRGSSSSTSTLLECVRIGAAPRAFVLTTRDAFVVVAAAAAQEIYGRGPAVVFGDGWPASRRPPDGTVIRLDHAGVSASEQP